MWEHLDLHMSVCVCVCVLCVCALSRPADALPICNKCTCTALLMEQHSDPQCSYKLQYNFGLLKSFSWKFGWVIFRNINKKYFVWVFMSKHVLLYLDKPVIRCKALCKYSQQRKYLKPTSCCLFFTNISLMDVLFCIIRGYFITIIIILIHE